MADLRSAGAAGLLLAGLAGPAGAAEITIPIDPSSTVIGYTVYALGLFPMAATYDRFRGSISLDPEHPELCKVRVHIEVDSLHMADPARRAQALAPDMMDVAHYPSMEFTGDCGAHGTQTIGMLTLHGVTRKLVLETTRQGAVLESTGSLRRRDYGINGLPALVGQQIRLRLTTRVPNAVARKVGWGHPRDERKRNT